MTNFIPPKHNSVLPTLLQIMLPLALFKERLKIEASVNCIETIWSLSGSQTVLMINHSDRYDPMVAFGLSSLCGEDFYYLAARELFDLEFGLRGWIMQQCGTYSVIRGQPVDEQSKEATISLIAGGERKLVMFPEGDVTGRDDAILPLKVDGLVNLFEAQKKALDQEVEKPVFLLPVSIYYEVSANAYEDLSKRLAGLESMLSLTERDDSFACRINCVLEAFIEHLEQRYRTISGSLAPDKRLEHLCKHVATNIGMLNGITIDDSLPASGVLYSVRGRLARLSSFGLTDYSKFSQELRREQLSNARGAIGELSRMQELLILARTLQQQSFSLDFAWRVIDRLEMIMTGRTSVKGWRTARIEASDPITVLDHLPSYEKNAESAIKHVDSLIRKGMCRAMDRVKGTGQRTLVAV